MPAKCFECGKSGHVAGDCPDREVTNPSDKPMWCRNCDRRSRLVMTGDAASRCPRCHPLAHLPLVQHVRCPGCRMVVYSWDTSECGRHSSPVKTADTRLEREEIALIISGEVKRHPTPGAE
jgi:hypothetical protein